MTPPWCAEAAVYFYLSTFALPLPLDIGLLGLALLGSWAALAAAPRFPPGTFVAMLPLVLAVGIGNLTSPDPARSLHLTLALIPAGAVYLLISGYFGPRQSIRLCLALTLISCAIGGWLLVVAAVHPQMLPSEWIQQSRLTAFKVPNDIVWMPILLPFSLALFKIQPKASLQSGLALTAVVIAVVLAVVYRSRLAVLVTAVSVGTFLILLREARHLPWAVLVLGVLFGVTDAVLGFGLLEKLQSVWTSRLPLWQAAWRMFLQSPLIGHGIGSYVVFYQDYLDLARLPGWVVLDPRLTPWAHNLYLEILAELGLIGLAALAVLLYFALKLWRPRPADSPHRPIPASAARAALCSFCLSSFFELSLWRQWVGLTFLLIIGCIVATNKPEGANHEDKKP